MPKNARFNREDNFGINVARVRAYRALHNKKQQDIADLLNISHTAYSAKEQGLVDFGAAEVGVIANYFKIDPGDLFSDSPVLS